MKPIDQLSEDEFADRVQQAVTALPDAPSHLLQKVIRQWDARQPSLLESAATAAEAVMRRITAALTFDSWAGSAVAFGVRSVPGETRHLLFSALGRDVDLRISPAAGAFALTGQILGPDETGVLELAAAGAGRDATARTVPLDALGEFRLEGVARGSYVLTLRFGSDEIALPPIDVGEQRP
jgi:hypothetical protein